MALDGVKAALGEDFGAALIELAGVHADILLVAVKKLSQTSFST